MPQLDELAAQLDRLAAFEAGPFPVVSLYLNLQADARGRDSFGPFVRKELAARINTFTAAPERESLERDAERIEAYLDGLDRSANGLALFACHGAELFEAFQLAAPIDAHRLSVSTSPICTHWHDCSTSTAATGALGRHQPRAHFRVRGE
jgi:hypothetical protein